MQVKQKLSILFFLKKKSRGIELKRPVYVRVNVDGLNEEISLSIQVHPDHWDKRNKLVTSGDPQWKSHNKKINNARTDIERHFDLMQVKHGLATAALVRKSYVIPSIGEQIKTEQHQNFLFSESIDALIAKYIQFCEKNERLYAHGRMPHPEKQKLMQKEKALLKVEADALSREGNKIFDNKDHRKTFLLTVNEYLLTFLQLSITGNRAHTTLEKWMGRKRKYQDFLAFRYHLNDMPLQDIEYSFIEEVFRYLVVQHSIGENTAMKYAQCVKEMMDRAVSRGWIAANVFGIFKCRYIDPHHDWLTMREMETLLHFQFDQEKLNVIRDLFVFASFTGLAYRDMRDLQHTDIITGVDGKKWISKRRQKTDGDETLPLLPIPLSLLQKYQDYPICVRQNKLLPVPSNAECNRCLKEIGKIAGFKTILRTHKARFFFANEVAYNHGVPLKTIGRMLGQKSVKTTEIYVRANREIIASSMEKVEQELFNKEGRLKFPQASQNNAQEINEENNSGVGNNPGGKLIKMRVV